MVRCRDVGSSGTTVELLHFAPMKCFLDIFFREKQRVSVQVQQIHDCPQEIDIIREYSCDRKFCFVALFRH